RRRSSYAARTGRRSWRCSGAATGSRPGCSPRSAPSTTPRPPRVSCWRASPLPAERRAIHTMPTPVTAIDPLIQWRREFPTTETPLHFISHSLGAMPRGVEAALMEYARLWKARGIRAWEDGWFELPTRVGDILAKIVNAPTGSVSMYENVTIAEAVALSAI